MYASVVIASTSEGLDKPFDYEVPQGLQPCVGSRVVVPFGHGNKRTEAYVVGLSPTTSYKGGTKPIISILDAEPAFGTEMLRLAEWMRHKYAASLYDCIRCIIPAGLSFRADMLINLHPPEGVPPKVSRPQQDIWDFILQNGGSCLLSELENEFPKPRTSLGALQKRGLLQLSEAHDVRDLSLYVKYAQANHGSKELEAFLQDAAHGNPISRPAAMVVDSLIKNGSTPVSDLRCALNISMSPINTLANRNIILLTRVRVLRNTTRAPTHPTAPPALSTAQERATSQILALMDASPAKNRPALIHGVTGSGKTEVYMRLIDRVLSEGKQALMLVPEISLTPQTVNVFIDRFGDKVSVTHSRLSLGERYDQWRKARDGAISIMIGPRSAVFAPFNKLGLIIIDEEHEKTYKSDQSPKFAAKEVALKRAQLCGGFVVLGSATPQIETYYDTHLGKSSLHTLPERINQSPPEVNIIDMRLELASGNTGVFGMELLGALKEEVDAGRQVILFLNRRGFSTFVCCRSCGCVLGCGNCSINYTYHADTESLVCHYCGIKAKNPKLCPQCGSKYIRHFGIGTQKLEAEVRRLVPEAATLRMDADTTTGKHGHEQILKKFQNQEAQILIGTQMIAKGLDFPRVTLVGVVAADLSLHNEDFRCAETTFQLLTQVSGRAGRAALGGKVYVQTYNPSHYAIQCAKTADYAAFYEQELAIRRQLGYPPFSHLFSIMATSEHERTLVILLHKLRKIMDEANTTPQGGTPSSLDILGPAPASIVKIRRRFRWRIIVRHQDEELLKTFVLSAVRRLRNEEDTSAVNISLTPNPLRV